MLHHNGIYNTKRVRRLAPTRENILLLSIGFNFLLAMTLLYVTIFSLDGETFVQGLERKTLWHGGHPEDARAGSCWCGKDQYCMCTPNLAIDLIIVSGKNREYLWLVRRKDTNQLATMGGFVDSSETVEHAVKRELKEEMDIDLGEQLPILFGVYSDPRRDNRRSTVSAVFAVYLDSDHAHPHAGDDAKEVHRISIDDIEHHAYFADHRTILLDYRRFVKGEALQVLSEGDFAPDILRSTCAQQSAVGW
jgi:8-oxo-dGTP diphosphatase